MTRQPKKPATEMPKPVEAWAMLQSNGSLHVHGFDPSWQDYYGQWQSVRVRIVPVKPKKRRVRKEK